MVVRPLILGVALALAGCAHLAPPTPESMEVDDFDIEGEKKLKEADIKEKIVTNESSWLPGWFPIWGRKEWFDPITWQADLRRIQRFYEANGYYQARILDDVVTEYKPKHVKLLVRLREGEPARVNTLDLVGLEGLPPEMQAKVVDELPIESGDIFLEERWAQTKALLALRLRELGFAEVQVVGEALVAPDDARADLTLIITPGTRYRFGKTFVATDPGAQVPPRLIADVASPYFPKDGFFSESAMSEAQARVFQMGVFAGVKVNRGAPDRDEGTVPIVIDVKEAPFHSVRFGGGLGGDLIRQEVRLVGEYTDRNLGLSRLFFKSSRLDRLTLKAKLGLAFLPNVVEVARAAALAKWGPTWRFYAEYEVPRMFDLRNLSFQGSVDVLRTLDNTYDYDAVEAKAGVIWRPRIDVTVFPSLNLNTFLLRTALELRDTVPPQAINCPQAPQLCLVGFLNLNVEFDRRDNRLEPREGFYFALDTAAGLSSTTQLRPFLQFTPEARGYVSFGASKQFTLAARAKFGALLAPENDTPIVVRYFSGGAGMRGFQQRRLAPQVAVITRDTIPGCTPTPEVSCSDGTTLPVGGSGLLEGSLEFRWAVSDDWVLALFNDWGTVTDQPLWAAQNFLQSLYTAVGFGVRYRTPLGPIRVDLAFRLPVGGPQQVGNTTSTGGSVAQFRSAPGCFFGLGSGRPLDDPYTRGAQAGPWAGSPDNLCSAHLSIGEAF